MTDQGPPSAARPSKPFDEVLGPAPASGHLGPPTVQVGVDFTVQQGAFPSGQDLETMERLFPGAVGRLIAMAEAAQGAQVDATAFAQRQAAADTKRGHWLGASLTALALVGAAAEGVWGSVTVACVMLGVPVFSAVKGLIDGVRRR